MPCFKIFSTYWPIQLQNSLSNNDTHKQYWIIKCTFDLIFQVDKLRHQAEEQEASLRSQENELSSKKQELEGLKQEEQRLEKMQEETKKTLDNLAEKLQESQLQISQVCYFRLNLHSSSIIFYFPSCLMKYVGKYCDREKIDLEFFICGKDECKETGGYFEDFICSKIQYVFFTGQGEGEPIGGDSEADERRGGCM